MRFGNWLTTEQGRALWQAPDIMRVEKARIVCAIPIEAGCKAVIGSFLKQAGVFWTDRGANAILALPCQPP